MVLKLGARKRVVVVGEKLERLGEPSRVGGSAKS